MHLDSFVSILVSTLTILMFLALAVKLLSRKVVVTVVLASVFYWLLHPRLRDELLAIFLPLLGAILPLLLMLLGLRIITRGRIK